MGQIHSDHRKVENSCNKYKHYKHNSAADVNEQHCIVSSSNKNVNKNLYYRSLPGNMSEQTNTVGAGTLNCNGNVFQKNSDDHNTIQVLPNVNPTTSSTSSINNSDSVSRDESSTQKIISVRKITGANVEMSQIKNNSLPTGTVVKPQKSLHRFCNITSNLRRSNAKSLFTPKRHKSVKSTHEASSCFSNSDVSKGSFTKKKRSNWVTRFNCTKLKCTKSTDHHSLSNTIANVEKQSSANANCVCMCYRKTEENNSTSDIKLQPESSTTFNKIITKSNPQTNSIISVTVQNINHERTRSMCKPHENQSSSVDSINVTEYRPVRKSSIPTLVSNSSESNLITMCKCSSSSACCSPTNVTGEASTDKKKLHHSSVKTLHNSMVCHNDNRDVHNITEVTDSKADPVFNVLPSRDSAQNQSSEISGSESLYGSFSDINNPQLVLDAPFDLVRLADCNSGLATINNHTSNCVQMLYSKGTGNDSHRCMQLVCHSDEITNRNNSTGHSNSHCSQGVSDDCLKTANGHYLLEPQPTGEVHHGQQSASSIEENIESSSQNSNDQSIPVHLNTSDSEQHVCSNKIIIPGQRRCLQLVCPTDISMESLKILFQSHFNSDTVLKCHTQVDYVHYLVPDLLQITSCSFYWGKMDRYEAERLLDGKPEGTFLLRDSAQEEFLFSVSFRKYGRSLHARIEQWNHKFSFDSHDPGVYSSTTVCGLIEHYKDPTCCMFFEPILTIPLHRNFTFTLQHLCRATIANKLKYDTIDLLQLPNVLKTYLKEYHYRQKVRVKRFDGGELQWVDYNTS